MSGHGEDKNKQREEDRYGRVCYMCQWPENKTGPMVSMLGGMNLYHDCIRRAFDSVTKEGVDFSKLPNMSYMNTNPNDLNMTPPAVEVPKKQKIRKKTKEQSVLTMRDIPAPHVAKTKLDEYIIGHEKARKVTAVAVYNHYKRASLDHSSKDVVVEDAGTDKSIVIERSNILMTGPTGSGKTYLVRTLARLLDVLLTIAGATSLIEAGYIGDDIESVVSKLLAAMNNDVDLAQKGVVFTDEIDKIAKKKQTNTRDVSGKSIQQGLPELLGGNTMEISIGPNQKNTMTPMVTVGTDSILFICGGALPDLEEIIKERLIRKITMGFGSILKDTCDKDPDILGQVINEDLRTFGTVPEFLGRLPVTTTLQGLTKDMMVRISKEPKNVITKQYERLLEMDEVWLIFEDEALRWITGEATRRGIGARALRAILEGFMLDIMYEILKDPNIGSMAATHPYLEKSSGPLIQTCG